MPLSADARRAWVQSDENSHPAVAADVIYEGAAVGLNAGNARPLVAADPFLGFSVAQVDNSAGGAGEKSVRVRARGRLELPVTGVVATSQNAPVYASDDETFTLTAAGNSLIGRVDQYVADGVAVVYFDTTAT